MSKAFTGAQIQKRFLLQRRFPRINPTWRALVLRYGLWATIRQAKRLGIPFDSVYWAFFGRLPRY